MRLSGAFTHLLLLYSLAVHVAVSLTCTRGLLSRRILSHTSCAPCSARSSARVDVETAWRLQDFQRKYEAIDFDDPDDKLIGMGIFRIGDDVRAHITQRLRAMPSTLQKTYRARRYGAVTSIIW